jgi:hypothetical protein
LGGKGWADFSLHKLEVLEKHGGAKIAIAGKMFVADEFRSVVNANLPFQVLFHDGPVGASSDLAKEMPEGGYRTADEMIVKLVGDHPSEYLTEAASAKLAAERPQARAELADQLGAAPKESADPSRARFCNLRKAFGELSR